MFELLENADSLPRKEVFKIPFEKRHNIVSFGGSEVFQGVSVRVVAESITRSQSAVKSRTKEQHVQCLFHHREISLTLF
jgi:hypothetical protein